MPGIRQTIQIFIASSSELAPERDKMALLLSEINKHFSHLYLEPVRWNTDLESGSQGQRVQDAINPLLDRSDVVVFLFYSKVGVFTLEEYQRTQRLGKKAFVYFKSGFAPRSLDEMERYRGVLEIRERLEQENQSLFVDFNSMEALENRLRGDLQLFIQNKYPAANSANAEEDRSNAFKDALFHVMAAINPEFNHPVTVADIVGCNRHMPRKRFWAAFDRLPGKHFQFYFVSACPTQMPPSLAERLIFEYLDEELRGSGESLWIDRRPGSERVSIHELPLGRNLERSKEAFFRYFCEREPFQSGISSHTAFTDFLHTGLPALPYSTVSAVFKLQENEWKDRDFLPEYLRWIIQTFGEVHENTPTFLFFFVVYVNRQHLETPLPPAKQLIMDALLDIVDVEQALALADSGDHRQWTVAEKARALLHPTQAAALVNIEQAIALLPTLLPVERDDLVDWFDRLGETNPGKINQMIEALLQTIPDKTVLEVFEKNRKLDMYQVEMLLEAIYKYDLKRK
ncbi:MAG: hypothetical protein IPM81_14400 [Saprospirales bacterium]|nr:hypothetical protein [Saprospirales bacterium]